MSTDDDAGTSERTSDPRPVGRPAAIRPDAGLWRHVAVNGALNVAKLTNAEAAGEVVGVCRVCGGHLVVDNPPPDGQVAIVWYVMRCLGCGHEIASPNGRLLIRSARASERPQRAS